MWNEFSRNAESWTGSQAQMMRMAQDAYCILKGSGTIAATGENCAAQTFHAAVGISPRVVVVSPSAQASGPDVVVLGEYLSQFGATFSSTGSGVSIAADVIATHNYTYGKICCASTQKDLSLNGPPCRRSCPHLLPDFRCGARKEVGATPSPKSPTRTCSPPTWRAPISLAGHSPTNACTGTPGATRGGVCGARVGSTAAAIRDQVRGAPVQLREPTPRFTHGWSATP